MGKFYDCPSREERKIAREICEFLLNFESNELREIGLTYIDSGCEKDVYRYSELPGWVIKMGNESCYYEAKNYQRAIKKGLKYLFAPSYFVMSGEKGVGKDGTLIQTFYFSLQKEVKCDPKDNERRLGDYIRENLLMNEDYEAISSGKADEDDLLENYEEDLDDIEIFDILVGFDGYNERSEFESFCSHYSLNDIHAGNIGYSVECGRGVMIDYSGYHGWDWYKDTDEDDVAVFTFAELDKIGN